MVPNPADDPGGMAPGSPPFQFKTTPFSHQLEAWERTRDLKTHAIFWEQGTGKSKLVIDTAAWLAITGQIDALLILAPQGVHANWVNQELPVHWPDCAPRPTTWIYQTARAATKWHQEGVQPLATQKYEFPVLVMTYSAIMTKAGSKLAANFLRRRKVLYVLDESTRIKTGSAKRTIRIIASGRHAVHKRILTGTCVTNSPFDVYKQFQFLDEWFWKARGFGSLEAFKGHFAEWIRTPRTFRNKSGELTTRDVPEIKEYKNMEQLAALVQEASSRVLKDDVLDLPPKLYTKRYFEMTPEQRRLYTDLKDESIAWLDSGEMVTAPLAITKLLRFQQILCGYLPSDDGEYIHDLKENPLLDLFIDTIEDVEGQAIVWARFQRDVDLILAALDERAARLKVPEERGVRYDGRTSHEARERNLQAFRDGRARFFVANPAVGGTGLTLVNARTVLYYSNSFDLEQRLQSEDRAHRIGQTSKVLYIDFSCLGTVLERIIQSLRTKINFAAQINGDEFRTWL